MRPSAIHGLKACIAGTRISVADIYVWHELLGMSPDQIAESYPGLTVSHMHTAIAYFHDHTQDIREQVQRGRETAIGVEAITPPLLPGKLAALNANGNPVSP